MDKEKLLKIAREYGVAMWELGYIQTGCRTHDKYYEAVLAKADKAYEKLEEFVESEANE